MINWSRYYPIFQPFEFTCRCGCGFLNVTEELLDKLYEARRLAGIPFPISSGSRCPKHNANVTKAKDSAHPDGLAVDMTARLMVQRWTILDALFEVEFPRIGLHPSFIHVDICNRRPQGVFFY